MGDRRARSHPAAPAQLVQRTAERRRGLDGLDDRGQRSTASISSACRRSPIASRHPAWTRSPSRSRRSRRATPRPSAVWAPGPSRSSPSPLNARWRPARRGNASPGGSPSPLAPPSRSPSPTLRTCGPHSGRPGRHRDRVVVDDRQHPCRPIARRHRHDPVPHVDRIGSGRRPHHQHTLGPDHVHREPRGTDGRATVDGDSHRRGVRGATDHRHLVRRVVRQARSRVHHGDLGVQGLDQRRDLRQVTDHARAVATSACPVLVVRRSCRSADRRCTPGPPSRSARRRAG